MAPAKAKRVERLAALATDKHQLLVLAISGGLDSMVLLHSLARHRGARRILVAHYNHGTGAFGNRAERLVRRCCRELGVMLVVGKGKGLGASEAVWREARWSFLRRVAGEFNVRVATAHTLDDHLETVAMRILRGAGARGVAGLLAESRVVRPFLALRRSELAAWAERHRITWLDDPSNLELRFFRNRVRLELLPALEAAHPGFARWLERLSTRAAVLRRQVDRVAATLGTADASGVHIAVDAFGRIGDEGRALLWPALAAPLGAVLDRRGIARLVSWSAPDSRARRVQLTGGVEGVRQDEDGTLIVRRHRRRGPPPASAQLHDALQFGAFRFELLGNRAGTGPMGRSPGGSRATVESMWVAALPGQVRVEVRAWQSGDRMPFHPSGVSRRVKRFFREARIPVPDREGWPVVLVDDTIVWIPGVRRSLLGGPIRAEATEGGNPPYSWYACERTTR